MPKLIKLVLPALLFAPQVARAQDVPPPSPASPEMTVAPFSVRAELNAGGERFQAQGTHRNQAGYGGTAGVDLHLTPMILVGVEGSYWRARRERAICTTVSGGTLCDRSGRELGAGFRAGVQILPTLLLYGKAGFVDNRQTGSFVSPTGIYYINGRIVGPGYSLASNRKLDGYQLGGGVEFSLMRNIYVSAQYIRSRYDDRTSRQRVVGGLGVRF